MGNEELDSLNRRINKLLVKEGILSEGQDYMVLLAYGYQRVLVEENREEGQKFYFTSKILAINAYQDGEKDFVVEIIMSPSESTGSIKFLKLHIPESGRKCFAFEPKFEDDKFKVKGGMTTIIR